MRPVTLADVRIWLNAEAAANFPDSPDQIRITSITSSSHEVCADCAFIAVRGETFDGHAFLSAAQEGGAALLIAECPMPQGIRVPYLQVKDARLALGLLASAFFGHPSHHLTLIGITGTSGKTTTTYLAEALLKRSGYRVGVLGTVNFRFEDRVLPSTHTTPGPIELQKILAEMLRAGATAVVMEVSSHALKQHRTWGLAFDAAIFLNLSEEHLDYHPSMDDYFESKARLFFDYPPVAKKNGKYPRLMVCTDDAWGKKLLHALHQKGAKACGFGRSADNEIRWSALELSTRGLEGIVQDLRIRSPLLGGFNSQNVLAVIALGINLGLGKAAIEEGIAACAGVPGRLERVPNEAGIEVLVDYAHKPDALQKVLETLRLLLHRERPHARLITVFGCGGDRDRKKRPRMGEIATRFSDHTWVTSDNPRTEDPDLILQEIDAGIQHRERRTIERDRRKAIHAAVKACRKGDLLLIAGKGHETYQIIAAPQHPSGTIKIHFDDREVAREALDT